MPIRAVLCPPDFTPLSDRAVSLAARIGRWYGADSLPIPTLVRVPFNEVRRHLPADTSFVTPEERSAQLRARCLGGQLRRRW